MTKQERINEMLNELKEKANDVLITLNDILLNKHQIEKFENEFVRYSEKLEKLLNVIDVKDFEFSNTYVVWENCASDELEEIRVGVFVAEWGSVEQSFLVRNKNWKDK